MESVLTSASPERGGGPRAQRGVEGHVRVLRTSKVRISRGCPTTVLRMVPLRVPGRNA
jgi:hypothetical protein